MVWRLGRICKVLWTASGRDGFVPQANVVAQILIVLWAVHLWTGTMYRDDRKSVYYLRLTEILNASRDVFKLNKKQKRFLQLTKKHIQTCLCIIP